MAALRFLATLCGFGLFIAVGIVYVYIFGALIHG